MFPVENITGNTNFRFPWKITIAIVKTVFVCDKITKPRKVPVVKFKFGVGLQHVSCAIFLCKKVTKNGI